MAQEAEPDISKLLAQANAALNSVNVNDFNDDDDDNIDMSQLQDDGDDENVQLTAEDMNDPELLAQLAEFDSVDDDDNNNDAASDDGDEKMFDEMKSNTLQTLKQVFFFLFSFY